MSVPSVDEFQHAAREWLRANGTAAPRDYGAICPPDLVRELMRGMSLKALAQRQGPVASTAASLMKLGITEMMFDVAVLRGDLAGANAMLAGPDAAGMLAAPGGRIAGGTSEVQRNIIGERLLGLPREPKSTTS